MDVDLTRFELLRNVIDALKANAPVASVVIAMLAFLVSLATYRRAWRWRSEAEPAFVQVQGDMLLVPEFKRAGLALRFLCDRPSVPRHQERSNRNGKCQRRQNKVPIHYFTPNGSRPSTRSVETSKKSAMRDTSRNVKFERPWNLSLMACSETPSSCARSRCVT